MNTNDKLKPYQIYIDCKYSSESSVRANSIREANKFSQYLDTNKQAEEITIIVIYQYIESLSHLKKITINNRLYYLKKYLTFLAKQKYIDELIPLQIHRLKCSKKIPKHLSLEQLNKFCTPLESEAEKLGKDIRLTRKQAVIEVFCSTGVRKQELCNIRMRHISPCLQKCQIPTIKRGNPRLVYLGKPARKALTEYLNMRGIKPGNIKRYQKNMYLFTSTKSKNPIHIRSIDEMLISAGIQRLGFRVSAKMLRHTFATEMLKSTECMRSTQIMMGHKAIKSTEAYTHLTIEDKAQALKKYHPLCRSMKNNE